MKKLYFLDEEEKNRILNIHESATKRQYLLKEDALSDFEANLPKETKDKFTKMKFAWEGPGTSEQGIIDALNTFTAAEYNLYNQYLALRKPQGVTSFEGMINAEMGKDDMDNITKVVDALKRLGVTASGTKLNINDFKEDSFKITSTSTNTDWSACVKQFGGPMEASSDPTWVLIPLKSDKVGKSMWFKNDYKAMFRPGGGAQDIKGTWACTGNKLTIKLDDKWTWNGEWIDPKTAAVVDPKVAYQQRAKQTTDTTKQIQQALGVETPSGVLDSAEVETMINKLKQ